MSEIGDTFKAWHESRREKKKQNLKQSLQILLNAGFLAEVLSDTHYRIGDFDFWPSTGKYLKRKTGKYGRGVYNLIRELNK